MYLAGPQDREAKLHLQEILNDRQTYSNESQPLEQRQISDEDSTIPSAKISIVTGTNIEPLDLSFLQDVDLSSFPRCDPCFRARSKCDGRRPCQTCQNRQHRWSDVTEESLEEFPDRVECILTGKRVVKPKKVESRIIDRSSFPRCDYCFRIPRRCDGGRPCQNCQNRHRRCRDVTEEALKRFPDRARRILEQKSQAPASDSPCRRCVSLGITCHRASSEDPCKGCIRESRSCSNNLEGAKRKGMYSDKARNKPGRVKDKNQEVLREE